MEQKPRYMPIWGRYMELFDSLTSAQLGELISAMMHYYFRDEEPQLTGTLLNYWSFLKQDMDSVLADHAKKVGNGRKAGK